MSADAIREALVEPAAGDPADTSDSALDGDLAALAARLTDSGGLFSRWREHPAAKRGWAEQAWGTGDDRRMLDDLRGAEFGRLDASGSRLAGLAAAGGALAQVAGDLRAKVPDVWHGPVADTAEGRFDRLAATARAWQDSLTTLAVALDGAREVAADALRQWTDDLGSTRHLDVDDPAKRLTQIDRVDDALSRGSRWGARFTVEELRTPGKCDLNSPAGPLVEVWSSTEAINYLDDFCARYDAAVGRFRRNLRDVHEATARGWAALADALRAIDPDPFRTFAAAAPGSSGERVVIRDGERTITVDNPDGRVGITVEDGSGPAKSYLIEEQGAVPEQANSGAPSAPPAEPAPAASEAAGQAGAGVPAGGAGGAIGAGAGGGGGGGVAVDGGGGGAADQPAPLAPGAATSAEAPPDGEQQRHSAPAAAGAHAAAPGQAGGMMGGGMGAMGGMGGAGAGGGQGGDTERKASQWRVVGSLFEESDPAARFGGVIGEDPAQRARK
ncbi:hypothetical protein [Actinokineospora iranica]|uniref:Proteins of 100 residues with WXG n=1 Tax=Actinokineospora iranica TaxID=1271860 RepID=A0A1G6V3M4_9PSEU|nr:hypothetical protein [Actinokineospora iranica]SDD48094.1 hypothetical protein SAMN05216174_111225 [Actinokineospora iranica]